MASLNANTTGAVDSAVTAKETLDFINMYGDAVVYQYLVDNRDIDDLLGNPAANSGSSPASLDMATKATGKLPMLSLAQQEEFYEAVSSAYTNLIDQLNQTGENRLEAQTLPLEAITHSRIKVFNGPGGESPFAADAYAEDVEVKKLTKPLSQAEVMNNLRTKLEMPDATLPQMERKGGEVMNQFLRSLQPEVNTYIEAELDKLVDANKIGPARTRLNGLWSRLQGSLRYAPIGTTIKVEMGRETYYGVVADVRKMGRSSTPLALSDYEVTVYTTDASRRLHIPASRIYTPMNPAPSGAEMSATFQRASRQESFMGTFTPIIEAFDHGQNVRTERRTIIAGNLLAGYGQFALGRVVNFTMKDGRLRQGILMPANFNVGTAIQDMPVKFANIDQVMQFLATLNTSTSQGRLVEDQTGNVRVTNLRGDHTLSVPGSKAQGARYFLNTDIRRAAGGRDFVRSGQTMMLRLGRDTATMQRVLEEMSKQGVEFQTNSFKDAARDITGEKLPETEIIPQDTAPNPGFEQAQEDREADEDNEMLSLIGEHGASNLPDARGRLANLNIAKQMDESGQYDANRIWLATGWEKGKEGKWKTEIDSNLFDIKDSKAKTLGEALHAPELFKAYPELKDVNVSINQKGVGQLDAGTSGSFNQQTHTITINEGSNFTTFSTLQHEIQHAIQYIEGFAVGTNWRQFMPAAFHQDVSALSDDEYTRAIINARDRYHRTAGEVEARNVQFRNDLSPAEKKRTSPGESEDVPRQRQIVLYESEMAAMAHQEMMSIADAEKEETDRRNAVKLLKAVPLSELTPSVNFNAQGDRIKINLPAMELLRRGFEQVDIDGGKRRFGKEETYPSFLGLFDDGKKLSKVADVLDKNGGVQAQQLAAAIRDALKVSNTAVFYVSDAKLPQELFHQAVYIVSVEKGLTKRHADAQKLDSSPQVAKADKYFFSKQAEYQIDNIMRTKGLNRQQAANFRKAIIREETAAWTAEGNGKISGSVKTRPITICSIS
jgi:hypothetical protein